MLTYQEILVIKTNENNNFDLYTNRSSSDPSENTSDELLSNCLVKKSDVCKNQDSCLYYKDDDFSESTISDSDRTRVSSDFASSSRLISTSDSKLVSNISMNSSTFKTLSDDSSNSDDIVENSSYYLYKNECNKFNNHSKEIKNQHKEGAKRKTYTETSNTVCRPNKSDQNNKTNNCMLAEVKVADVEEKLKYMSISNQPRSTKENLASRKFSMPTVRRKRNLTFNRQELIKIERDNSILLKKIINLSKPRSVVLKQSFSHKRTSAAINRAKIQKKIDQENVILCRRLNEMGRAKSIC